MTLSDKAKRAMTTKTKTLLALAMDCSIYTIEKWIRDNEVNGDLTKAKAVQVIAEETNLAPGDILEESDAKVA